VVGIPLRSGIGLVAEKLLNGEQVNAVLGQPCGKCVAKIVKPKISDAALAQSNFEGPAKLGDVDGEALRIAENGLSCKARTF
jgi:hypothetical protein